MLIASWRAGRSQRALSIEKLTHGYQDRMLFDDTSLEIEKGERVAVIGAHAPLSHLIRARRIRYWSYAAPLTHGGKLVPIGQTAVLW